MQWPILDGNHGANEDESCIHCPPMANIGIGALSRIKLVGVVGEAMFAHPLAHAAE